MYIPQEFVWIQHLIEMLGVTGTLRLISANCAERAGLPGGPHPARWEALSDIVAHAAEQTRRIEPERMVREE